jgi:hypothetical protein
MRYIREGRGQGEGEKYSPWLRIHDFASSGTVSRIAGSKTHRVHHFMSMNEKNYFYLLEWADDVLDIREQYPLLDIELAVELAGEAGIRYPRDSISGFPYVLTCDFMITAECGLKARTIKLSSELSDKRVLEKLEIERRYWENAGVEWRVVTENEIPLRKVRSIEWLHAANSRPCELNDLLSNNSFFHCLKKVYTQTQHSIYHTSQWLENEYCLESGVGLKIIRHLLWAKQLPYALESELQLCLTSQTN